MFRIFLVAVIFFVSQNSLACDLHKNWKWGVSYGLQPHFDDMYAFDATTPRLFGKNRSYALNLNITTKKTSSNIEDTQFSILPVSISLESRRPVYKELISAYARLGIGYTFIDEDRVYKADGFLHIPIEAGIDFIYMPRSTVFIQYTGSVSFVSSDKKTTAYATTVDGSNAVSIGYRRYY